MPQPEVDVASGADAARGYTNSAKTGKRAAANTDPRMGDIGEVLMMATLPFPTYCPGTGITAGPVGSCCCGANAGGGAAVGAAGGGTLA